MVRTCKEFSYKQLINIFLRRQSYIQNISNGTPLQILFCNEFLFDITETYADGSLEVEKWQEEAARLHESTSQNMRES